MSDRDLINTINDRILDLAGHGELLSTIASKEGRGLALEVLDVLRSAGYAVTKLSPPESPGDDMSEWWGGDIWCAPGSGRVRIYVRDSRFSFDEARGFAADVLAAALCAEAAESDQ